MTDVPDWYRGVNIAYQALAQLIVRPKYGGAVWSAVEGNVTPNDTTYAISISGKGMIYQIFYYGYSTGIVDADYWSALIDGNPYTGPPFSHLKDYNYADAAMVGSYITLWDTVNYKFGGGTAMGITFESSYILGFTETYGRSPYLYMRICYALIA